MLDFNQQNWMLITIVYAHRTQIKKSIFCESTLKSKFSEDLVSSSELYNVNP